MMRAMLSISHDVLDEVALGEQMCSACIEGSGVDGAGISLRTEGLGREMLCASDPTMALIEELQYTLGEGPCIEAAITGRPVLIPDVRRDAGDQQWPVFAAAIAEQPGVGALFAVPLLVGAIKLGVLDLYRAEPGPLPDSDLNELIGVADIVALKLLGVHIDPGNPYGGDHMSPSRAEVHQATGMLIGQLEVSAADAFARLRAYAYAHNRLLHDVARDVVNRDLRFSDDMD